MRQILPFLAFVCFLLFGVTALYFTAPREEAIQNENGKKGIPENLYEAYGNFTIEPSPLFFAESEPASSPVTSPEGIPAKREDCVESDQAAQLEVHVFDDFLCPYCTKQFLDNIFPLKGRKTLSTAKNTTVIFHTLPVHGEMSAELGKAAFCAGKQQKIWEFQQQLFLAEEKSTASAAKIMSGLGGDMDSFNKCLLSEEAKASLEADIALAEKLKINVTPSIIIGEEMFIGDIPTENIEHAIRKLLAEQAQKSLDCNK